jgi:hypothetical protein
MPRVIRSIALLAAVLLMAACGAVIEDGNLKFKEDGRDIVSIGRDGFKLNGNITGFSLNDGGLSIEYPNGSIVWDSQGFVINHAGGNIRIAEGNMAVTDKDGNTKTLNTAGQGAEYATGGGVLVKTGKKASIPMDYPLDKAPLMDGFILNASAELGSVLVVSGYVPGSTVEKATAFYQKLLIAGDSYSHDKKGNSAVLKSKLSGTEITVYLAESLTADAVNVSIVSSK